MTSPAFAELWQRVAAAAVAPAAAEGDALDAAILRFLRLFPNRSVDLAPLALVPLALILLHSSSWRQGIVRMLAFGAAAAPAATGPYPSYPFLRLGSKGDFVAWAQGRAHLRLEDFYRQARRRHDILMGARRGSSLAVGYGERTPQGFLRD